VSDVYEALADYQDLVLDHLLRALPTGEPQKHLYDLLPVYPSRRGKALRAGLLLATCSALGGDWPDALPLAVGLEMLHNAFLVHDDIQDGSRIRRGQPTLNAEYGLGLALCAGNALALEAMAALRDAGRRLGGREETVMREVERAVRRTIEGQATEIGWQQDRHLDVSVSDYLNMVLHKTSWYSVILPCRLALLAAGVRSAAPGRFVRFGSLTGAVLQIGDDLMSLTTSAAVTGKDWGDDVVEGKRSLPVVHCLTTGPEEDRRRLGGLLRRPAGDRQRSDARWVVETLDRCGSLDFARRFAAELADEAHAELAVELAGQRSSAQVSFLHGLIDALSARCEADVDPAASASGPVPA
jgi:geranylgeranyl diphosphate synthase, type II